MRHLCILAALHWHRDPGQAFGILDKMTSGTYIIRPKSVNLIHTGMYKR